MKRALKVFGIVVLATSVPVIAQTGNYDDYETSAERWQREMREGAERREADRILERRLKRIEAQNRALLEAQAKAQREQAMRARLAEEKRRRAEMARPAPVRAPGPAYDPFRVAPRAEYLSPDVGRLPRGAEELVRRFQNQRQMAAADPPPAAPMPAPPPATAVRGPPAPKPLGFAFRKMSNGHVIVLESGTGRMHRFAGEAEAQAFMAAAREAAHAEAAQ